MNSEVTASLSKGLLVPQRLLEEECPRLITSTLEQKTELVSPAASRKRGPECQDGTNWFHCTR